MEELRSKFAAIAINPPNRKYLAEWFNLIQTKDCTKYNEEIKEMLMSLPESFKVLRFFKIHEITF